MAKLALLIGVSDYQTGLAPLPAAVRDMVAMARVLEDPELGGFDTVKTLENPSTQALREEIETFFQSVSRDDFVTLFFSGHGVKDDKGALFFATPDTKKNLKGILLRSTALEASFVQKEMNDCRAKRQVVILDCCFSGAIDPGLQTKDDGNVDLLMNMGAEGRVVLASSSSTQYSFEISDSELSLYTRYLVEGIETGAGDVNGDGFVSTLELHDYAAAKVQETAPSMTPKIITLKDQGFNIVLSRAKLGDPRLQYRKEVSQQYTASGEIDPIGRSILDLLRGQLQLSDGEAEEIEAEVLRPYQERLKNIEKYKAALIAQAEREFPFSEAAQKGMQRLQALLGLRDEDVVTVQQQVEFTQKSKASIAKPEPTPSPSQEGNRARVYSHSLGGTTPNPSQEGNRATPNRAGQTRSLDLGNGVSLTLVYIPAGTFWMGSKPEGIMSWITNNERPRHQVTLSAFWMGETPVTQGQYQAVMGKNPSHFQGDLDRPVENVRWQDADRFCQELSKQLLKTTQETMTLPSESQWEYACRAGTDTRYSFGNDSAQLGNYAWYGDNSGKQTHPVKQKKPNAWGLYDMHGNVWEWCADHWHGNYEGAPTDSSAWLSSDKSQSRLLRGGSWSGFTRRCRSAARLNVNPALRNYAFGFRVVCSGARTLR